MKLIEILMLFVSRRAKNVDPELDSASRKELSASGGTP